MPRNKPSQIHRSLPACEELLQVHDGASSLNPVIYMHHSSRATSPASSFRSSGGADDANYEHHNNYSQFIGEMQQSQSSEGKEYYLNSKFNSPSRNSSVSRVSLKKAAATTPGAATAASDEDSEIEIEFYEDDSIPRRFRRSQDFGSFFTNAKNSRGDEDSSTWGDYGGGAFDRAEGQEECLSYEGSSSARFGFPKRVSASAVNVESMDLDYEGYPGLMGASGSSAPQYLHVSGTPNGSGSTSLSAVLNANKRSRIDLRYAWQFVMKAIQVAGGRSSEVPTQKQIQSKGMTTTKQQKARNFLKSIGAITVNTRTELAPRFPTLGDLRVYLESQMDPRDLLSL